MSAATCACASARSSGVRSHRTSLPSLACAVSATSEKPPSLENVAQPASESAPSAALQRYPRRYPRRHQPLRRIESRLVELFMVTLAAISGRPLPTARSSASAAQRASSRSLAGGLTGRAVQALDGESRVRSGQLPHDQGGGGPRHREAGRSQYGGDAAAAVAATVRMGWAVAVRMGWAVAVRRVRTAAVRAMRRPRRLAGRAGCARDRTEARSRRRARRECRGFARAARNVPRTQKPRTGRSTASRRAKSGFIGMRMSLSAKHSTGARIIHARAAGLGLGLRTASPYAFSSMTFGEANG